MKKEVEKEQSSSGKAFSVVFRILNILLGFLFLFFAFIFLIDELPFRLYLCLATSLFAFFPKKVTRVPTWLKFVIIIVVFLIIFIAGRIILYQANNNLIYNNIQESFTLDKGDFSIIVYNTTNYTSIRVDNETRTTEGYFLLVNCGITNLKKESTFLYPEYSLIDNKNNTYLGLGFSGYNKYFQPSLEKDVYFVFDVPNVSQGLKFVIKDGKGVHFIDLNK